MSFLWESIEPVDPFELELNMPAEFDFDISVLVDDIDGDVVDDKEELDSVDVGSVTSEEAFDKADDKFKLLEFFVFDTNPCTAADMDDS